MRNPAFFILLAIASLTSAAGASAGQWHLEKFDYDTGVPFVWSETIRAGYFSESSQVPFKGNILYLEGLGDSMLNHRHLFTALSNEGYRVISFDYIGQGGSTGTMNHTRVDDLWTPSLNISALADIVWNKYARPGSSKKIVLGWSLGGLAAYEMAYRGKTTAVILIAPALQPYKLVGDMGTITLNTLTSSRYLSPQENPHVDPIRPDCPGILPQFAADMIGSAFDARVYNLAGKKGLVLLAGAGDRYVDNVEAESVLRRNAPDMRIVTYPNAFHEIDNEPAAIRNAAIREIIGYLRTIQ